jgi:hypothetical protein
VDKYCSSSIESGAEYIDDYDVDNINILTYPYSENTEESHGTIFSDNGDGSIIFNGTAIDNVRFHLVLPNS